MTISSTVSRVDYTGNATTATYAYTFPIIESADLVVYRAGILLVLTTDYTVTGVGNPGGGNVVLVAGNLGTGVKLSIIRVMAETQLVNYVANDSFPAETHEQALDRLTMMVQQLQEAINRRPGMAITSTEKPTLMPVTFASLSAPSSFNAGMIGVVSDSSVNTWGTTIAGGGSFTVLAFNNGTVWTVVGA